MTPRKTRILFISRAYGEHAGGMERLSFELISELKKSKEFEIKTILYETKPGNSLFISRARSLFFALSIFPRAIMESRYAHAVHIGDPVLSLIGWYIARLRRIPIAVTVHGLDVSYGNIFYQVYLQLFFRSFQAYIAISDYTKKLAENQRVSGNITMIPPGIHDRNYDVEKNRNDLSAIIHKDANKKIVLATTGRLISRKGHAWFIRHVMPKLPLEAIYCIAGDGPERASIEETIADMQLEDRVLVLGRVSDDAQRVLLNTIDAFVQPNILIEGDIEGFGIAPLEAALCGRPVFASKIDGIPSAIHDGKNGVLLPYKEEIAWADALTEFVRNPKSFQPSSSDAREYTKQTFAWHAIARQYENLFQSLTK